VLFASELIEHMRHVWVAPAADFNGTWTTYFVNGQRSHKSGTATDSASGYRILPLGCVELQGAVQQGRAGRNMGLVQRRWFRSLHAGESSMRISATLCTFAAAFVCSTSLAADLVDPVPACEDRMGRVFSDFRKIREGVTTRGELHKLLHADGGIASPSTERFVHPLCAYCKITVTFKPHTRRPDGGSLMSDDDPVVEVSKAYLESMFMD